MKQVRLKCVFKNAILLSAFACLTIQVNAQSTKKPNVLILWGDDIGTTNISAYSDGVMGYTTPNIDRLANEGLRFLHYYGEQSCTAGRAALLTGQHGLRTGLTKVGFPGAPMGMSQLDPSIGGIMKNLGYTTGQFGKNHVGDRNESLPTVNGFDEFFGNLYHLNAEEEPELPDYPKDPEYLKRFGPRGVLKCAATNSDDATTDPRFGRVGKQRIEDTGPLTKKRMETIDDETSAAAIDFIKRQNAAGKPFFCWFNATRMHLRTHVRAEHRGRYTHGDSEYIDGMIEHDETIGSILKALDELGIADNTIVIYSTDNGPHMNTWPDAAMTPYRSEKNTNWEGAFRVPCIIRWPGVIKPGQVTTELMSHNDWMPTLASIAGEPDLVNKLLKGYTANGKNYKVHLDGFDQSNFLRGKTQKSARDKFFYTDDDGLLVGLREGDYKYVFAEQRLEGTMGVWAEPFTKLRLQKIFNLYQDPFERADITSNSFWEWQLNHVQLMYGAIQDVVVFAETFKDYPPRSIPPSFSAYTIMEEAMKDIKAQKYIEKNVLPKLKEDEAADAKKKK
ncbi:arylsulfatase [Flavobacterium aquidurense]|uniref:Arylsulfatase n=1 Tax=Flavobacterium frigidimaris TaxID=262320 RepID=A0ABX4BT17_FLAFR|nr:arylsulfatase [Flavobacterium frigidimaris]OXA80157.1 arylsulfatase [Flavobacterium frigidimaris]SDZ28794.1 arylsulfatase [Flavobacterium aquidurense]